MIEIAVGIILALLFIVLLPLALNLSPLIMIGGVAVFLLTWVSSDPNRTLIVGGIVL